MIPGETVLSGARCPCGADLTLGVYPSAAGYYVGFWCPKCGPYSRETDYFYYEEAAEAWLEAVRA